MRQYNVVIFDIRCKGLVPYTRPSLVTT